MTVFQHILILLPGVEVTAIKTGFNLSAIGGGNIAIGFGGSFEFIWARWWLIVNFWDMVLLLFPIHLSSHSRVSFPRKILNLLHNNFVLFACSTPATEFNCFFMLLNFLKIDIVVETWYERLVFWEGIHIIFIRRSMWDSFAQEFCIEFYMGIDRAVLEFVHVRCFINSFVDHLSKIDRHPAYKLSLVRPAIGD